MFKRAEQTEAPTDNQPDMPVEAPAKPAKASKALAPVVATRLPLPASLQGVMEPRVWRVLCESIFPSAKSSDSILMALDYCQARKLDVMKRPVNIVPMWNKTLKAEVETVWPSINEVQTTAARTGQYAGMDMPQFGPDITKTFSGITNHKDETGKWLKENVNLELTFPEWVAVTIYRMIDGVRCPFTEPVYWLEAYARMGKTDVPNQMWSKRPRGQVIKVAKAFAIRAAFPEEGEYVAEEMQGLEIQAGGIVIENAPQAKQFTGPDMFTTAGARRDKCVALKAALEEAVTLKELREITAHNQATLDGMRISSNQYDRDGAQDIEECFVRCRDAIKAADAEAREAKDKAGE